MAPAFETSQRPPVARGPLPIPALIVAVVTAGAHLILDIFYRPWAWKHQLADLSFADSFTNMTAVIGLSAAMVLVERRRLWADPWQAWLVVAAPVIAMSAYEFLQPLLPWGTFSVADLIYTLIGGLAVVLLKLWVYEPLFRRQPSP